MAVPIDGNLHHPCRRSTIALGLNYGDDSLAPCMGVMSCSEREVKWGQMAAGEVLRRGVPSFILSRSLGVR
jgi:hypothetical protein